MTYQLERAKHPHAPGYAPVGRGNERVVLREELVTAFNGHGRLILIGGEAGIGKTTLARELAAEAATRGALVLVGHCYDLTYTPPYGPWLDLFDGSPLDETPAAFAGGRLRESITDQAALFAEVRDTLAHLALSRPVLAVLEDLHWTDPASIELLRFLAARLAHLPLLVVATYRADELTRSHPLARQLPALIRESDPIRLDLKRLTAAELRELVATRFALSADDESRLVAYLRDHADGNPFFATELLRALTEAALLRPVDGGWELARLDHLVMPPLLRQVIDGRIARLGEETREPLALAAVIGQEIEIALWSDVGHIDEEALFEIVNRAVDANLLDADWEGTRVRFVHALTREALYEGMLPPRRRVWHRRIADVLMARAEADPDAVAAHLQRAGDPRALGWLFRSGDRAQRAYALRTAVERFRAAAALLSGIAGQERTRGLLLYRSARLQRFSTPAAGIVDLDEAEGLAHAAGDVILAAEVLYSRGLLRCYADDWAGGMEEQEAGIAALEVLSEEMTRAAGAVDVWLADALPSSANVANDRNDSTVIPFAAGGIQHRRGGFPWWDAAIGRLDAAEETGKAFLRAVGSVGRIGSLITSAAGHAGQGLAIVHAASGRPGAAQTAFARAREYYQSIDHHAVIAFSWLTELRDVVIPYRADDPDLRLQAAAAAQDAFCRGGGAFVQDLSPRIAWLAWLVLEGRWDDTIEFIRESPPPGPCFLRREMTDAAATISRHRGDVDDAWLAIDAVLPAGPDAAPGTAIHQEALFLQRLAADLAIDADDLPLARAWLETHDRWLAWNGALLGKADGQLGWARYFHALDHQETARVRAEDALALASNPRQPLTLLAAHRLLGRLATETREEDTATRHLEAALDLAIACAAPFERAQTLLAMAELLHRQRRPDEAAPLLAQVVAICTPLGARPILAAATALAQQPLAAPGAPARPFALTAREADVLCLAATGLTDAAIAERLFISRRTVGQHLRAVYAKLDVSSRAAATRVAIEHGLA